MSRLMLRLEKNERLSRHWMAAAAAVALVQLFIPAWCAVARACVADCDDSGQVALGEVVTATRVALGTADLEECPSADANRDGSVEVDELISGVTSLLRSCPLKPPALVPSAALGVARLAAHIHALSRAVAVAFDGSDRTEQCVYGGTLDNMCEDTGTGFVLVDVDANMCRVESLEGDVTYNGPSTLTGMGR